jgi:FkbM family methyltransferase
LEPEVRPIRAMLRPRKVRRATHRRWFERRARHVALAPAPGGIELLGSSYGGWLMPVGLLGENWLCYSVGAGGDVSFDLELIRRYGARVRSFDAVRAFVDEALAQADGEPCFSAHHAAIATSDGPLRMQLSHDPRSRSVSSAGLYDSSEFEVLPGRTINSLMGELGDEHIDLLKLDIEGAEYEVVPTLDLERLGVQIFGVQLHHCGSVAQARGLVARVRGCGYEPVAIRPVLRVAFASRELLARGAHAFDGGTVA